MSEEEKVRMDKKSNPRLNSPVQKNGADIRKDVTSRNPRWGKRRGNGPSGNYHFNDGQGKKPSPQKYKNTWDKRPRPRGELSERPRSDLEENFEAEYGSAFPTGSKKGNLNHLLNFSYGEEEDSHRSRISGSRAGYARNRIGRYQGGYWRGSKSYYNKEQFLQANCQFVVKEARDYSAHLIDPDTLVDWDAIEQVRVISSEPPSCPICLEYPIAAKMTRCGHIYCWACILHYLAVGEKTWRKCPICYESIHSDDLKSVVSRQVQNYKVGDTITMTLMRKEKGSIYAVPAHLWQRTENKCHNVQENEALTRHMKLLTARPDQVLEQMKQEKDELMVQMATAESSEEPFIKGAQEQLQAKQVLIIETPSPTKDSHVTLPTEVPVEPDKAVMRQSPPDRKIKVYKSAFSDEEDEEENNSTEEATSRTPRAEGDVSQSSEDIRDCAAGNTPVTPDSAESPEPIPSVLSLPPPLTENPLEGIPESLPVEEAAEQLELPTQVDRSGKARQKSGDQSFYFYQSEDGQHIYLHSLNARCLVREYGSLANSPQTITATIVEKESVFVSEELRKRLRYLSHLPLTCGFEVVELNIKAPVISKDTIKYFTDEIEKRRRQRQRRNREEKRMARRIEEEERKKMGISHSTIVPSQFGRPGGGAEKQFDARSDSSSQSQDTPVGSPGVLGTDLPPSQGQTEADDGSQASVVSFAQMLKGGVKAAPVWPKKKSETKSPPTATRRQDSDESDNEDKVPVPEYQSSFGNAIEAALVNIDVRTEEPEVNTKSSGRKKKKQLVLFSTSMARGGK